ncbi:MAG: hypothetical protein NTZ65_01330 [Candidatus Berkelbacteria bacterium]|nr:hypothetical protein [Candidatus Berkelbacteria bacterium]
MKKTMFALGIVAVLFAFSGCQFGKSSSNTDNADSAVIDDSSGTSQSSDIGSPPVPPEPTRPS